MSLVYSTDKGRVCPDCGQQVTQCRCKTVIRNKAAASNVFADGSVRLQRQIQGRGGKTVTVISGLALADNELQQLAKLLKQRCGSGGSIKNGAIEIQGDHRDQLKIELETRGYKVKLAGG
jgi:translation initiation factor 1